MDDRNREMQLDAEREELWLTGAFAALDAEAGPPPF